MTVVDGNNAQVRRSFRRVNVNGRSGVNHLHCSTSDAVRILFFLECVKSRNPEHARVLLHFRMALAVQKFPTFC